LIAIVIGSMLDTLLTANCTNHGVFFESTTMPYGLVLAVGGETSVTSPVLGISRPTMLLPCSVNHSVPFLSKIGVCGSRPAASGIGYSVTSPVFGLSLPTCAAEFPVYQILPSLSATSPWGPDLGVFNGNSFIAPVLGSSRPSTLAHCPVHQIAPSGVARGS
jgi:hypothetical protein